MRAVTACAPRHVSLFDAQSLHPHLLRAREEPFTATHLWAPVNDMPCWHWEGWLDEAGYGRMQWGEQRSARVHRVTFELLRGYLDPAHVLDHQCRNRPCCNPWHLQPITIAENTRRGARAEGICRNGLHAMEGANVIERWREGLVRMECRACKEARR